MATWTQEEEAEYQALKASAAKPAPASGAWTPAEEAEYQALKKGQAPKPQGLSSLVGRFEDYYKPESALERGAMGAVATVPFSGALWNKAQGQDAYQGDRVEQGSAMLGDVANAGLTALTLGKGLGAGAALNAGLEASGINEGLRKGGEAINNSYEPQTQSVGLNMLLNTPKVVGDVALNAIPALLAAKMKVPGKSAAPEVPADVAARASFAKAEGIPLTKGETLGKTTPAAMKEAAFRKAPGGEKASMDMQAQQQAAVKEALAKRAAGIGDDVLAGEIRQGGGMSEGRQLSDVPDAAKDIRAQRGQAVGDAKKALAKEIPLRGNFAKELSAEIDGTLAKVRGAGKGSDRAMVADLLESYKEQAGSVKTMAQAINFLDDFDTAIKRTFDKAAPSVRKNLLGSVREKIVGVLDEAGEKLAPEQQAQLKTAKAGFSEIADEAQGLRQMEDLNPSALLRRISNGDNSLSKVRDFHTVFEPGTSQRQGLKSALVQDVIKKGTQKGGISGEAMGKALDRIDKATLSEIFSDNPKELADFRSFVKGLEDIEQQRTPLGTSPDKNSHTAALQGLGRLLDFKVPGTSWALTKLNNYRSGRAFKPYQVKAPKPGFSAKGLEANKGLSDLLTTKKLGPLNPLAFGRQAAASDER